MAAVRNPPSVGSTSASTADLGRSDFFLRNQYYTRELPRPSFTKVEEVRAGVTRSVRSLAWSCDGRWVAVGMDVGEIKVYEARSTFESKGSISLAQEHPAHVSTMAFSPVDPDILISGCKQNKAEYHRVAVWNIKRPKEPIASFKITGDVLHIAFHPSGTHFAAVCPRSGYDEVFFYHMTEGEDGKAVWKERNDIALGESATQTAYEEINSLRFHNSGKAVCAVSNEGSVNAWKFSQAPRPLSPQLPAADIAEETMDNEEAVVSRASTPREATPPVEAEEENRDVDATNGNEGETAEETAADAAETEEGTAGETKADDISAEEVKDGEEVSPDTKEADEAKPEEVTAENGGDVEMADNEEPQAEVVTEVKVDVLDAPSTENEAASASKAEADDVEMTESKATVPAPSVAPSRHPSPHKGRKPEPPKKRAGQLQRIRHVMFNPASLLVLAFDPLGRFTAVAGQDALVRLLDSRDWICQRAYSHCSGAIRQLAFSPDGELLAVGGDEGIVCIISIFSGELVAKYDTKASINALCWHPKRNWLAWSSFASKALVWYVVRQEDGR